MILTLLAIIWTAGAAVGAAYSFILIREYREDLRVARLSGGKAKIALGTLHLRAEINRFTTQVIAFLIGVLANIYSTSATESPEWVRTVSRFGIVAAVMLVYANSILMKHGRDATLAAIDDGDEHPAA